MVLVLVLQEELPGEPNCLLGIREHVWLGEIDENSFHNIDDPNCERRKEDAFVGLKNLGATCYVNTYLQIWFLNLPTLSTVGQSPSPACLPAGDLCISENERRVVSKEAWKKLKQYFPKAPEFPNNKECCSQCKILEREGEENKALHKMMASEQKTSLQNLFHDKCRPCLGSWPQETDELYIVSQFFVEEWRKFVRRPTRCSPVSSLGNSALLCPHGGLMFSYASMTKEDSKLIALIWPSEWERIQKLFVVDHVIKITRTQVAGEPESALYSSEPQLCPECREGLLCQQQRDLREYTQATIYIHKVVDNKKVRISPSALPHPSTISLFRSCPSCEPTWPDKWLSAGKARQLTGFC
ncbi:ubiquitin carboxyl-terminal hydrolase 48-like [Lagopus muta]|uniref:ubiquitin carboxyl-terminal hydrolase 48-like n=1 Tax=Lagopus muta TaxID=64668 RepID=UPI0020A15CB8|nr:ubiquitin carboxyl-terminal hydrolase 48-like [Lagopus muta]